MTEDQVKNTAKSLLAFMQDYSREDQLHILAHMAAIKTVSLSEEEAEEWVQSIGNIRFHL